MSGMLQVNVPDYISIGSNPSTYGDVSSQRENAIIAYHSDYTHHIVYNNVHMPSVDYSNSRGVIVNPIIGIGILPGGYCQFNPVATSVGSTSSIFLNWYGVRLTVTNDVPNKILFNYDGSSFVEFNPTVFNAEINSTIIPYNTDMTLDIGSAFTAKFTNVSSHIYYLTDFYLCYR